MRPGQFFDAINRAKEAFEKADSVEARKERAKQWQTRQWKLNPQFAKPAPLKVNYALIEELQFTEI